MALPRIIEFLLAQNPGAPLVGQGFDQTVAIVPPLTRITLQRLPVHNNYAAIVFLGVLDPQMIPGAFYGESVYWGNQIFGGLITDWALQHQLDSFVVITQSQSAFLVIQNLTDLNQLYSAAVFFITISTEANWNEVIKVLKRLETSEESVQLQKQANSLLNQILKAQR